MSKDKKFTDTELVVHYLIEKLKAAGNNAPIVPKRTRKGEMSVIFVLPMHSDTEALKHAKEIFDPRIFHNDEIIPAIKITVKQIPQAPSFDKLYSYRLPDEARLFEITLSGGPAKDYRDNIEKNDGEGFKKAVQTLQQHDRPRTLEKGPRR